jgi:predicted RNA-binding Zn ribbon-like protein
MSLTPAQFLKKGHGKTACWLDLVNSEEWDTYGNRTDWIDDPCWLPYFLQQWHFIAPAHSAFPAASFKTLRAVLRKSCQALFAGQLISGKELRALNDTLNVAGKRELFRRQHGLRVEFVPESKGWEWILAEIALSFADLLARESGARVKICDNPDCRWVFYDTTKGKTRRWCSDKVCGNRYRVRRARVRVSTLNPRHSAFGKNRESLRRAQM